MCDLRAPVSLLSYRLRAPVSLLISRSSIIVRCVCVHLAMPARFRDETDGLSLALRSPLLACSGIAPFQLVAHVVIARSAAKEKPTALEHELFGDLDSDQDEDEAGDADGDASMSLES